MSLGKKETALAALVLAGTAGAAGAQKLDKDAKTWLDEVRPIMLAEEEKIYRELKNDKETARSSRRSSGPGAIPTPGTPANEFQDEFDRERVEADAQFKVAGRKGSETDCGRVFLLLGKPDEMKAGQVGETPVLRPAETWTYRDRPGQTFAGGQATIEFEANCELAPGQPLRRRAEPGRHGQDPQREPRLPQGPDGKRCPRSRSRSRSRRRRRRCCRRRARTSRSWSSGG